MRGVRLVQWEPEIGHFFEQVALVEPLPFGHLAGSSVNSDKAWISMPG